MAQTAEFLRALRRKYRLGEFHAGTTKTRSAKLSTTTKALIMKSRRDRAKTRRTIESSRRTRKASEAFRYMYEHFPFAIPPIRP